MGDPEEGDPLKLVPIRDVPVDDPDNTVIIIPRQGFVPISWITDPVYDTLELYQDMITTNLDLYRYIVYKNK